MAQPCRVSPTIAPNVYVRPAGMRKMRNISTKLVSGVGFSIWMGGVGVEEAAAVRAQLLDCFLRSNGALRDDLFPAFDGLCLRVWFQF